MILQQFWSLMSLSVLISEPDDNWSNEIKSFLDDHSYACDESVNGKECQLKVYKKKYLAVVLDLETQHHSAFEVLKYLRLNAPSIKVILTIVGKKRLKELELEKDDLRKLGASDILIKPYSLEMLLESIEGANQFESWKDVKSTGPQGSEEEVQANDDEFTRIKVSDFYSGNSNIFDCYIRLSDNKYIKILHKGEFFEESRLNKYAVDLEITHLYFKTKERAMYINFINTVLSKMVNAPSGNSQAKINTTKNLSEKYVEEIYMSGLKPQLIEEGKKICENMYTLIKKDPDLSNLLSMYEEYDPHAYSHLFLVSFMASITCQNLEWSSQRTVEIIAFGSLLHDIGKLKLPPEFLNLSKDDMTDKEMILYKTHPKLGAEMLQQYPLVTEPIRQIVYQHHECITGDGFPNGLTGTRIYPLAKIVSFADEFSSIIMQKKIAPLDGLRLMLSDRKKILKFDPDVVKALVKGFVRK
jgi:putative nucleotidyltransferase with HDIG domain